MVIQEIPVLCPPCEEETFEFVVKTTEETTRLDCMESVLSQLSTNKYCNNTPNCMK